MPVQIPRALSAAFGLLLALTGCESAFEVKGTVDTTALAGSQRALVVFFVIRPQEGGSGEPPIGAASRLGVLVADAEAPPNERSFGYLDQGCGPARFAVLAWAPRELPGGLRVGGPSVERERFAPAPGDPVASSAVIDAECTKSGSQRVNLVLPPPGP